MLRDIFWEVSELEFEGREMWSGEGRGEHFTGTAAGARALKGKEGLDGLRRERKAHLRGAQCHVGYFTR